MINKFLFKRAVIKGLSRKIMEEDINAKFAENTINTLRKMTDKKEQELSELKAQIESTPDSHKKEDRDKIKALKAKATQLEVHINKNLSIIAGTIETIDEKRANIATWEKKIEFIKKNY